jgi:hypothetical protein
LSLQLVLDDHPGSGEGLPMDCVSYSHLERHWKADDFSCRHVQFLVGLIADPAPPCVAVSGIEHRTEQGLQSA